MRKLLLACGVLSPLLYAASDALAGSRWEGYSFRDMTVSELGAIGAPTRALFSGLVLVAYALLLAFGVGVWKTAGTNTRLRAAGGLLIGLSVMAWVTAPFGATDLRTEGLSPATTIHIVLTALGALTIIAAMGVGATAFGTRFRVYSIATIVAMIAFAAWSGMRAARPEQNLVTPWLGVIERVSFYSPQLWYFVLALMLLRRGPATIADGGSGVHRHVVISKDGTRIGYLSTGRGPSVVVIPGVLSMAADYAAFARALSEHFTVHTIERRGRGESGPQGDDYGIVKECEDVLALCAETGASLLVGHSYGGLVALEVARGNKAFTRLAVYEPGVSIDGSMPKDWMPAYEKKLAGKRDVDAFVDFILADAPPRISRVPRWLMKLLVLLLVNCTRQYRQMLSLLHENLREWREIIRLDNSYENYRDITAGVLLMYGGKSDSRAVDLAAERLAAVLPRFEAKEFPALDHFGIERTAPREVARAVADYFLA